MRRLTLVLVAVVVLFALVRPASAQQAPARADAVRLTPLTAAPQNLAQQDQTDRVDQLTTRVARLESRVDRAAGGALAILFGAFCALWAQNTKRSAVQWFFLGAIFSVIAVLVLLAKNSEDIKQASGAAPQSRALVLAVVGGILIVGTFLFFYLTSMATR